MEVPYLKFNYDKYFTSLLKPEPPKDYSKMTEEELLAELKKSKDFEKMVFPNSWYSKYDLPLKECRNMKEFIQESTWLKSSQNYYIEKVDIPAKPGGNRPVLPAPEVPAITLLENHFSDNPKVKNEILCLEEKHES